MKYFSIRITVVCIVDEVGIPNDGYTQDVQVHIIQAANLDMAIQSALEIGRKEEHSYKNEDGKTVVWKFKSIESVLELGECIVGKEVSTRMEAYYPKEPLEITVDFKPEESAFDSL